MFRHCRHLIWNHEDRCSQRMRVALAIVFTALALAAPRAHGQRRSMAMQRGMMMRFPPNTMFSVTRPSGFSNPNLVNGQMRPFPVNPTMFSATVTPRSSNPVMAGQPTSFTPSMAFGSNPFNRFGNFNQFASPFGFNANPYGSLYGNAYGMAGYGGGGYGGGGNGGGGYGGGANGGGGYGGGGNGADSSYGSPYMSSYGGTDPSYAPDQQAVNDQQGELSQGTNRRKVYDEYLYQRDKTPTTEEERQKSQREQLQRSLNNPPATEIRSGQALNVILTDLGQLAATGDLANGESFPLPLDEEGQKHINVTRGAGNIDLKNEGRLTCPLALSGREFKEVRERLAERALNAARQVAQGGQVEAATLLQMQGDVDQLHQQLRKEGKELPISEYIAAKTFLNQFEAAIKAMRQPDIGSHFNGKYALKAKTIPELVKQMTEQGLQFAPAMPEDEAAYAALHSALAAYYRAARAQSLGR